MCGFEEVTHEPDPAEFRPTVTPDPNITSIYFIDEGGLSSGEKKLLIGMAKFKLFFLRKHYYAIIIGVPYVLEILQI